MSIRQEILTGLRDILQDISIGNGFDTNVDRVTFADTTSDQITGNEIWIHPTSTLYTWKTNCEFTTGKTPNSDENWEVVLHLFKKINTDVNSSGEALLNMEIFASDVKKQLVLNKDLQNISGFNSLRLAGEGDFPVIAGETNIIERQVLLDIKFFFDENNI